MDEAAKDAEGLLKDKWVHLGEKKPVSDTVEKIQEFLDKERMRIAGGR
jgi:small subunit ribosomal protein S10